MIKISLVSCHLSGYDKKSTYVPSLSHLPGQSCVDDTAGVVSEADVLTAVLPAEENLPLLPGGRAVQPYGVIVTAHMTD